MGGATHGGIEVRPLGGEDGAWADALLRQTWGEGAARRGELVPLDGLPGFVARLNDLVALRRGAVAESRRRLKPSIPERGYLGIPIAHELELQLELRPGGPAHPAAAGSPRRP